MTISEQNGEFLNPRSVPARGVIRFSMSPPPSGSGGHPPRPRQAVVMSVADMETAVDARLALEHCDNLREAVTELGKRVGALESACTATGEARGHRTTIVVAVIGVVGSLVVGIVMWALNAAVVHPVSVEKMSECGHPASRSP